MQGGGWQLDQGFTKSVLEWPPMARRVVACADLDGSERGSSDLPERHRYGCRGPQRVGDDGQALLRYGRTWGFCWPQTECYSHVSVELWRNRGRHQGESACLRSGASDCPSTVSAGGRQPTASARRVSLRCFRIFRPDQRQRCFHPQQSTAG